MGVMLDVKFRWQDFNAARDSLHDLPNAPGLVRSGELNGETSELVVRDLRQWFEENRGDLVAVALEDGGKPVASWTSPNALDLDRWLVEQMNGSETLRSGRPVLVKDEEGLAEVPTAFGVYRIHRTHDDTWYVGTSSNLRSRLRAHARSGMYDLSRGDVVELILAKDLRTGGITTWSALQRAESLHIRKLKEAGKNVVNITGGGNGNPPQLRFNALVQDHLDRYQRPSRTVAIDTWSKVDGETEERIPGTEYPVLNLQMQWSNQRGEWSLHLGREGYILALAPGHGPIHEVHGRAQVPIEWLQAKYARARPGRSLQQDIEAVDGEWTLPASGDLRFFMHKRKLRNDAGEIQADPAALAKVSVRDVKEAKLPAEMRRNGFSIDPSFVQQNNINSIVRVTRPGDAPVYLKTEENRAAVRSELLVSLLWHKLDWSGRGGRVTESDHGVLVIPALGSGGLEDLGPFGKVFKAWPDESAQSMRTARPWTIKRLGLGDLGLRDPLDVARFVIVNAVTGNTDRHKGNVHLGRSRAYSTGSNGYLLPLDHGRCLLNNDSGRPRPSITGTPIETVRGDIANPHQLLRPLSELVKLDRKRTLEAASGMLIKIGSELVDILGDPAWSDYQLEVSLLSERAATVSSDIDYFLDKCVEVVI